MIKFGKDKKQQPVEATPVIQTQNYIIEPLITGGDLNRAQTLLAGAIARNSGYKLAFVISVNMGEWLLVFEKN